MTTGHWLPLAVQVRAPQHFYSLARLLALAATPWRFTAYAVPGPPMTSRLAGPSPGRHAICSKGKSSLRCLGARNAVERSGAAARRARHHLVTASSRSPQPAAPSPCYPGSTARSFAGPVSACDPLTCLPHLTLCPPAPPIPSARRPCLTLLCTAPVPSGFYCTRPRTPPQSS